MKKTHEGLWQAVHQLKVAIASEDETKVSAALEAFDDARKDAGLAKKNVAARAKKSSSKK